MTPVESTLDESMFPEFKPDFSSSLIVDNIPQVGSDKMAKLLALLLKVYGQIAPIKEDDIFMPFDEATGTTYGFCFIKFASAEDAEKAMKSTQGLALDKKHTFRVSSYNDLERYAKVSENDQPPELKDFHPKPDVASWLTDPKCRDQFSVRYGKETEIFWSNGQAEEATVLYGGEREKQSGKLWCELNVEWSPQGTYFVTFHKPGVKLWGGSDFVSLGKFMHPNVKEIAFSPCENYIITYRAPPTDSSAPVTGDPNEAIIVWDVRTGEKLKAFPYKNPLDVKYHVTATIVEEKEVKAGGEKKKVERSIRGRVKSVEDTGYDLLFTIEEGNVEHTDIPSKSVNAAQDPNKLKWSPDGKYVARLGPDIISVFELPSMNLLDKKSIAARDVLDFTFSPRSTSNPLIAYYSPAVGTFPALINILSLPDRKEVASRKIVDVTGGQMVWQSDGDYLCVLLTKTSSAKGAGKKKTYVIMFFRVNLPGVPVEQIELTEPILQLAWEPSRDRLAILFGDARSPQLAVYSMITMVQPKATPGAAGKSAPPPTSKSEISHLLTRSCGQCSEISWSPAGGVLVLAYFAPDAGVFEFFDVDSNSTLQTRRQDRAAKMAWDPSGRILATYTVGDMKSTYSRGHMDEGVNFFTIQGGYNNLSNLRRERFFSFAWRPRPRDLLTPEERKKVVKNLKKYEKEFEKEDKARREELSAEFKANRHRIAKSFLEWLHTNQAKSADLKPRRVEMRSGYDSDDERNYEFEVVA